MSKQHATKTHRPKYSAKARATTLASKTAQAARTLVKIARPANKPKAIVLRPARA